jgi:NADP-dependent 3-hydroxy acid dehydrogenase YdfG
MDANVVVVTGASSGIGRATARLFAEQDWNVVVAARRADALETVAEECLGAGGDGIAVPTDVSDESAVHDLARRAIESFGRIDAWVNNAGVYLIGDFEQTPADAFRRLYDVNVFGVVNGCRAVLPHFRQRNRGVIVNVASVDSYLGTRYATAYASSKWAVRGFSDSLRQDLRGTGIDVCVVSPAAVDTPLFQHAANYSGRRLKAPNPTYDARSVAEAIFEAVADGKRERIVGAFGKISAFQRKFVPAVVDGMFAKQLEQDHFLGESAERTDGNLWQPIDEGTESSGGWGTTPRRLLARLRA